MKEVVGRLLHAHASLPVSGIVPDAGHENIQDLRRERLTNALAHAGSSVTAETASILADGLATGRFAVTDNAVYLINDGGDGIKAECKCKSGSGECVMTVLGSSASCNPGDNNPCNKCSFVLGLTISVNVLTAISLHSDSEMLGQAFLDQLPKAFVDATEDLAVLDYPITDRLVFQDQLRDRGLDPSRSLFNIPFPALTLADALDKLFASQVGDVMGSAIGNYQPALIRNLARVMSTGAIHVDEGSRELQVMTKALGQGVTVDVDCLCHKGSGGCVLSISSSGGSISCLGISCQNCLMMVQIPSVLLEVFA